MSFIKNFNKIHPKFIQKLLKNYSDLTHREVLVCMYLKQNYSNKQISENMGISKTTVDTFRHRARKKMNLKRSDSMISILNRL